MYIFMLEDNLRYQCSRYRELTVLTPFSTFSTLILCCLFPGEIVQKTNIAVIVTKCITLSKKFRFKVCVFCFACFIT